MGGWGKIKIKDHLSPAEAETWTELGKTINAFYKSYHSKSKLVLIILFIQQPDLPLQDPEIAKQKTQIFESLKKNQKEIYT